MFIFDFILNMMTNLSIRYMWITSDWYFPLHNVLEVTLYFISITIYCILYKKLNLRYRERQFLKFWLLIPIIVVLSKLFPLIINYISASFLLNFYNVLTIHSVIFTVGILMLYLYRKNKIYLFLSIIIVLLLVLQMFLVINLYKYEYIGNDVLSTIKIFINKFFSYDIDMLFFLVSMYWDDKHDY